MPTRQRSVLASVGAAVLLTAVASVGADDGARIDLASVDDVTLALSRLAIENLDKCERIRDFASQYLSAANEGRSS